MGKRGIKPQGKTKISWSHDFAYAIGLIATDGCLSNNGRCVILTSKDDEQLESFLQSLNIKAKIGINISGFGGISKRVQLSDILFYRFLQSIGLTPKKSKTFGTLKIPRKYFFDFLRGVFDGDGSTYSYWDRRWRSSFMFYVCFASASPSFINWLQETIQSHLRIRGHVTAARGHVTGQLKYAKGEGLKVLRRMYGSINPIG